nr:hypothetical protein Itr_chr08CG09200 [Ipomoea trifida]
MQSAQHLNFSNKFTISILIIPLAFSSSASENVRTERTDAGIAEERDTDVELAGLLDIIDPIPAKKLIAEGFCRILLSVDLRRIAN